MAKSGKGGVGKFFLVGIVIILGFLLVRVILSGAKTSNLALPTTSPFQGQTNPLLGFLNTGYNSSSGSNSNTTVTSPYSGSLSVSLGNSSYEIQPYKEYITINNTSNRSVDITGMIIKNSKGTRPIENSGNSYFYPSPETAVIPQGAKLLAPSGVQTTSDIILLPGEVAYVITGNPAPFFAPINFSFKENECTGYLADDYSFEPKPNKNCPMVKDDPAAASITKQCYDYVRYLPRCENPEKQKRNSDILKQQTTLCQNFVTSHMNYPSCVAEHYSDSNFYGNTWHIFLGKSKEMWVQDDSITLMDSKGNIVATSNW